MWNQSWWRLFWSLEQSFFSSLNFMWITWDLFKSYSLAWGGAWDSAFLTNSQWCPTGHRTSVGYTVLDGLGVNIYNSWESISSLSLPTAVDRCFGCIFQAFFSLVTAVAPGKMNSSLVQLVFNKLQMVSCCIWDVPGCREENLLCVYWDAEGSGRRGPCSPRIYTLTSPDLAACVHPAEAGVWSPEIIWHREDFRPLQTSTRALQKTIGVLQRCKCVKQMVWYGCAYTCGLGTCRNGSDAVRGASGGVSVCADFGFIVFLSGVFVAFAPSIIQLLPNPVALSRVHCIHTHAYTFHFFNSLGNGKSLGYC